MLIRTDNPPPWLQRFEAKIEPEPMSGCWLWMGARSNEGHGAFFPERACHRQAHRISWELERGAIPPGMHVVQVCGFRLCVNPVHLRLLSRVETLARASTNWQGNTAIPSINGTSIIAEKTIDQRIAWLAGIIDGEGSIGINFIVQGGGSFRFAVKIGATDPAMIAEAAAIADICGIKYFLTQYQKVRATERMCYGIVFTGMDRVEALLRAIFPYLITKRAHAELALRALAHRRRSRTPGGRWFPRGRDREFVDFVKQMRELNRRGRRGTHTDEI